MQSFFVRGHSLLLSLLMWAVLAILVMFVDQRTLAMGGVRQVGMAVVAPLQFAASRPSTWWQKMTAGWYDYQAVIVAMQALQQRNIELQSDVLLVDALRAENNRLRQLLQANQRQDIEARMAHLLHVETDPFVHRVVLNKGSWQGVFAGQAVLDGQGVVGQIAQVGPYTSQAILISDPAHALPVQSLRSGARAVLQGTGSIDRLDLLYATSTLDLQEGDLLVTSGLGGRFPAGYPVGIINDMQFIAGETFGQINVAPLAALQHNREYLLLWPNEDETIANDEYKPLLEALP